MKHVCNNKKSQVLLQMTILLNQCRVIVRVYLPILYSEVKILSLLPQEMIWFTDLIGLFNDRSRKIKTSLNSL